MGAMIKLTKSVPVVADVVFRACHKLLKVKPARYESEYDFPYRQFLPNGGNE